MRLGGPLPGAAAGEGRSGRPVLGALLVLLVLAAAAALPIVGDGFARRDASPGWAIERIRLRAAPAAKADRLLNLPAGSELTLLGKPEAGYYPVSWGKVRGWAPTGAVETPADGKARAGAGAGAGTGTGAGTGGKGDRKERRTGQEVVAGEDLEVRDAASGAAAVVGALAKGDAVQPTGEQEAGFLRVGFAGGEGWVAGNALEAPKGQAATDPAATDYKRSELIAIVHRAADRYGQNREDMVRVARCESDLIPGAINAVGGSYGLFQFKPQTWARTPYAEYDIFDPRPNAMAAAWLWSQGGKVEWVCQ